MTEDNVIAFELDEAEIGQVSGGEGSNMDPDGKPHG